MANKQEELEFKPPDAVVDEASKPPEGYTEEEWTDLSETERAGILESIKEPEGGEVEEEKPPLDEAALKAIAEEEEAKKAAQAPEEQAAKPGEKKEEAAPAPVAGIPSDEDLLAFVPPVFENELAPVDNIPADIQAKLDELDTKYDDGDLKLSEYNTQRDALNRQVMLANIQQREAQKTDIMWRKIQSAFFSARPEYLEKIDKDTYSDKAEALFGAFDKIATKLARTEGKTMVMLLKADKQVKDFFGVKPAAKEKVAEKEGDGGKPPTKLPEIKTLTGLPPAGKVDEDPWSALDKLKGEAYEAALEKLTPEQRDRYLDSRL